MRDDNEKRGIRELGFRRWFTDVYWYHYRWTLFAVLAAALVLVWILILTRTRTKPDATVILVTGTEIDGYTVNALEALFASALGDYNGDGEAVVAVNQYVMGTATSAGSVLQRASDAVTATFLNNDLVLYLFDGYALPRWNADDGRFSDELAQRYGGADRAIPISALPVFEQLGFTEEYPLWLCIKGKVYAFESSHLTEEEYYGAALTLLDRLYERYGGPTAD